MKNDIHAQPDSRQPTADDREALARATLDRLIRSSGQGYAAISRLIGRNAAYVQQYVKRGVPRQLAERDRRLLARYFGVSEETLGALPATVTTLSPSSTQHDCVEIRRLRKSAAERPMLLVDRTLLNGLADARENWLIAHRIDDDSMAPTISNGDLVLIDTADQLKQLRDGIYAIENDNRIFIKRLSVSPITLRITILSDNAAYTSVAECDASQIHIVGKVVWHSRVID